MKIRNGFVSNSSSSSFVITVSATFPNVFALAKHMISKREWTTGRGNDTELRQNIRNAYTRGMDPDTPLAFSTCNYNTRIMRDGRFLLVSTCTNHEFDLDDHVVILSQQDEEDLQQRHNITDWDAAGFENFLYDTTLWYPEWNLTGKAPSSDLSFDQKYCNLHRDYKIELQDGSVVCPACKRHRKPKI